MAAVPALTATGLVKEFGDKRAVDGVDILVPTGSIYGILGPNGAGKTTLLRMLLGIIEPDQGTRQLMGSDRPRSKSYQVGYLPEERGLYSGMRAREAIAFMGALRGLDWATGRERADELLAAAGLPDAPRTKIGKLSKGMAQLVQLLGSIVHRPDLIVLDEPFSGLDPVNQGRLEDLILAERDRGATVLFSTHIMAHAQRLCDRLAIIVNGKRRYEGSVDDARAMLPMQAHYTPRRSDERIAALLPEEAVEIGQEWRFPVPEGGMEALLERLLDGGYGIAGLSLERPSLHDVFVALVGAETVEKMEQGTAA